MDGNGQPALLYIVPCTLGMGSNACNIGIFLQQNVLLVVRVVVLCLRTRGQGAVSIIMLDHVCVGMATWMVCGSSIFYQFYLSVFSLLWGSVVLLWRLMCWTISNVFIKSRKVVMNLWWNSPAGIACTGTVIVLGWWRGELKTMWTKGDQDLSLIDADTDVNSEERQDSLNRACWHCLSELHFNWTVGVPIILLAGHRVKAELA